MNGSRGERLRRGAQAERFVARHLEAQGYRILARNVRLGRWEIDLVARSPRGLLVFCEVRARSRRTARPLVHPAETVTEAKRRNLRAAAAAWIQRHQCDTGNAPLRGVHGLRFDVAAVWLDASGEPHALEYYEGAF